RRQTGPRARCTGRYPLRSCLAAYEQAPIIRGLFHFLRLSFILTRKFCLTFAASDLAGLRPRSLFVWLFPALVRMMSNWLLPESLADILPAEARRIEELRRGLLDLYRTYGFELVAPPLVEYLES